MPIILELVKEKRLAHRLICQAYYFQTTLRPLLLNSTGGGTPLARPTLLCGCGEPTSRPRLIIGFDNVINYPQVILKNDGEIVWHGIVSLRYIVNIFYPNAQAVKISLVVMAVGLFVNLLIWWQEKKYQLESDLADLLHRTALSLH